MSSNIPISKGYSQDAYKFIIEVHSVWYTSSYYICLLTFHLSIQITPIPDGCPPTFPVVVIAGVIKDIACLSCPRTLTPLCRQCIRWALGPSHVISVTTSSTRFTIL